MITLLFVSRPIREIEVKLARYLAIASIFFYFLDTIPNKP